MTITAPTAGGEDGVKSRGVPGLGPLESAVMLTLWQAPRPLKVAEVGEQLTYHKEPAYTTVMTILNILWRKGLARRLRLGRAWRYTPALSRDDYLAQQIRDLISFAHDPGQVIQHALKLGYDTSALTPCAEYATLPPDSARPDQAKKQAGDLRGRRQPGSNRHRPEHCHRSPGV